MTQAYNLSQLANNLNSSGQLDATDGLVNAVPVANGGTGASTAAAARTSLNVPTRTGGDASGTWSIDISGNAATATTATTATNATNATNVTGTIASDVTAITQAISNNSTKVSTTAFVQNIAFGRGQSWQDVTSSRAFGTSYSNSTDKAIMVYVGINSGGATPTVDGIAFPTTSSANNNTQTTLSFIVPPGISYSISGSGLNKWIELR